jgi:glycosyltransferase involved in cell wall biosynthesis
VRSQIWHIITSEYPPQLGGVADYTHVVAAGLGAAGDDVHVWCPASNQPVKSVDAPGVTVHRELRNFSTTELRRIGRLLDRFPSPQRLLLQWVPHGFGLRAMNLPFCLWLWRRVNRCSDRLDLMVHEPYLPFRTGAARHDLVAAVQRIMTTVLLHAADRVFVSIPGWKPHLKPYLLARRQTFVWLPIPSVLPNAEQSPATEIRDHYHIGSGPIVGHFGTFSPRVAEALTHVLPSLLENGSASHALLIGVGSEQFCQRLCRDHPRLSTCIRPTGAVPAADIPKHLAACDIVFQPYPDGVSSRRTSVMAPLSLGIPIVTTRGCLSEPLWSESGAVALTNVGDYSGMIQQLQRLLSKPTERREMAERAQELYRQHFDVRHTLAALRGVYSPRFDARQRAAAAVESI